MNTTENNKIIAEFLGYKSETKSDYLIFEIPSNDGKNYKVIDKDLEFYSNWNWLMEVVEKIESLGFVFNITSGNTTVLKNHAAIYQTLIYRIDGRKKIQAVYNTCVEFIKWYNQQKN